MENLTSPPAFNNYKGVMLCNRPNENVFVPKERPFCSRVNPSEQIGLTIPKGQEPSAKFTKKQINTALERHKKWLDEFKISQTIKKQQILEEDLNIDEKFKKVREMAKKDREITRKMKDDYRKMNELIMNELNENEGKPAKPLKLNEQNLKKLEDNSNNYTNNNNDNNNQEFQEESAQKQKPKEKKKKKEKEKPRWALTEKEEQNHQLQEEDELLNFVNNLDYDSYVNDLEVNIMLKALQKRVEELKQDKDWKEKAEQQYDNASTMANNNQQQREPEDIYDRISQNLSKNDEAKSVASEKTQSSINKLRENQHKLKQGKQEWEKSTVAKPFKADIEDRIAKHVADEILRTYKHLGNVHSNNSIRKLLVKEAIKTLGATSIEGPLIQTTKPIDKTKNMIDPNNLPYLHRNPAI